MDDKSSRTGWLVLPAVAFMLALGSVMLGDSSAPDPEPRARLLQQDMDRFDAELARGPRPVAASLGLYRTEDQAAPLAESIGRDEPEAPRPLQLAVGIDVAGLFDDAFERAFEQAEARVDLQLRILPGRDPVDRLLAGSCDAAVVAGALSPRELQADLRQTRLGDEVYALAVPRRCSLQSLANWQLRALLNGEIDNWSQLGGEAGAVSLVLPTAHGLAERAARCILDGGALRADGMRIDTEQQVFDQLLRTKGTIGLVRAASIAAAPDARLLQIDAVTPTRENLLYGFYPFGTAVTLVTAGAPSGGAAKLCQFARSEAGRELLGRRLSLTP